MKKIQEYNKMRGIRLSDKVWNKFVNLKPRDKSWDLFFTEILDIIKYFKNL